ncbi:hypothetical protein ACGFYY_23370 [Streptomyces sp. NPDC048331]|uniref:hypothetical protein n=1 Tax=Streptomyces sp. NPDC048331 TaxID=3365534 RepID=UPI003713D15C
MAAEPSKGATVTPTAPAPPGQLRPLGQVVGHATDPFTGERLVRVQWPGRARPTAHDLTEVVELD